jgi:hypothetical protein
MAIEIKQDTDGRHWLVVIDGGGIGGFKSKAEAERFIKSGNLPTAEEIAEIKKIEWWTDEQADQMWKILNKAHKAEAKKRGVVFKFYARSEGCFGSPRIFSDTNPGCGFWTGVNPYTMEAHHLWYPCSDAELERWQDLIRRPPRMN